MGIKPSKRSRSKSDNVCAYVHIFVIAKIPLFLLCKRSTLVTGHLPQFNIRYLERLFSGKTNVNNF